MKSPKDYSSAQAELQELLESLQASEVKIDELDQLVERATYLLTWCKERLRATETSVNKLFEEVDESLE